MHKFYAGRTSAKNVLRGCLFVSDSTGKLSSFNKGAVESIVWLAEDVTC